MLILKNKTKITRDVKCPWATLDYQMAHIHTSETINIPPKTNNLASNVSRTKSFSLLKFSNSDSYSFIYGRTIETVIPNRMGEDGNSDVVFDYLSGGGK